MQFGTNNINKSFFIFGCFIFFTGLFNCSQIALAQPLDPSLPGYEKVMPPERPTLKIIAPESNSTVLGSQVTVEYIISGISLVEQGEKKINIRGEGHLRLVFAREGYPVPTPILFARKSPITFEDIPEGNYRITMEIVKNSGESFDPSVDDTTKFQVVHPVTPTPTSTPIPTPTPLPLRARIPFTKQEMFLSLGLILVLGPGIYLLLRSG